MKVCWYRITLKPTWIPGWGIQEASSLAIRGGQTKNPWEERHQGTEGTEGTQEELRVGMTTSYSCQRRIRTMLRHAVISSNSVMAKLPDDEFTLETPATPRSVQFSFSTFCFSSRKAGLETGASVLAIGRSSWYCCHSRLIRLHNRDCPRPPATAPGRQCHVGAYRKPIGRGLCRSRRRWVSGASRRSGTRRSHTIRPVGAVTRRGGLGINWRL